MKKLNELSLKECEALVGRLLMAYQAIQNNMIPPLIENEHRNVYLEVINEKEKLNLFLEESIEKSLELIQ